MQRITTNLLREFCVRIQDLLQSCDAQFPNRGRVKQMIDEGTDIAFKKAQMSQHSTKLQD